MTAFCALLPLATVFVSFSFGGATTPFVLLQIALLLPLVNRCGERTCFVLTPLLLLSVAMRLASLITVSKGALSLGGAVVLALICLAVSCGAAVRSDAAILLATPLLFVSIALAIFVTAVSFSGNLRTELGEASAFEVVSAFVCPISACIAFSSVANLRRIKRFCALTGGILICAVFIVFEAAGAEFAFLSVPLAVLASSVEIKALLKGIKGVLRE